jgi:hypothetical protein
VPPTSGKNRRLVADEPVEFEKQPVEVQDFKKLTNRFRGIFIRIYYLKGTNARPDDVNV